MEPKIWCVVVSYNKKGFSEQNRLLVFSLFLDKKGTPVDWVTVPAFMRGSFTKCQHCVKNL